MEQVEKQNEKKEKEPVHFSLEDAKEHVEKNHAQLPENPRGKCVDGRLEDTTRAAYPGGELGVSIAALAAVEGLSLAISSAQVFEATEEVFGGAITMHTDGHAVQDQKDLACAGCGHARLALEHPQDYGLSSVSTTAIEEFVNGWAETNSSEVLQGNHGEGAVIFAPKGLAISGLGASGRQSFVYNPVEFEDRLLAVADHLYALVPDQTVISRSDLQSKIVEMANRQLNHTVANEQYGLAVGLPQFKASQDEEGVIKVQATN